MKRHPALRLAPVVLSLLIVPIAACGSDGGGGTGADASTPSDASPNPDTGPGPISCAPQPFAWGTGPAPTLTPDASWRETLPLGWSDFAVESGDGVLWVKFTILLDGAPRIVFQNGNAHVFHSDFARERLDPFVGMSREQFDAVSLRRDGQRALLGTVLMSSWDRLPELGVQLIGADPYPAELVAAVLELVAGAVESDDPVDAFYMPTGEQARVVSECASRFAALGVDVSSTERWTGGLGCYSQGWAIGELVAIAGAEVADAFEAGTITTSDVLLTRDVPAELPPVAGILTTTPSAASSHVAILASTYGAPYALLPTAADVAAAEALVGRTVAVAAFSPPYGALGCELRLVPVDHLDATQLDALRALGEAPALDLAAKEARGALVVEVDGLEPADIRFVGGKAANYGVLRDTIPEAVRPAKALTFDLWDAFLARPYQGGTLGSFIADTLAAHTWPADIGALADDLRAIRAAIEDQVALDPADMAAVEEALGDFEATRRLRFRSSTNVEDSDVFTGAGLYESRSGCLADDTDGDDLGPSRCEPEEPKERGIWRAIRKVYASFYGLNATVERLRHGVDEAKVGMGVLVHYSFPDPDELANGVGLIDWRPGDTAGYILSSQIGATSVANPDPGVLPEIAIVNLYSSFQSVRILSPSSLLPLGAMVLADDDEYIALAQLLEAVREAMAARYPGGPLRLDFEYKKERTEGLVVKQVRKVPTRAGEATVTPFLIDDGPVRLCTFQGEHGDVFGNHRLKSRWTLGAADGFLDEDGLAATFYDELEVDYVAGGQRATLTGGAASWPDAFHTTGEGWDGASVRISDGGRPSDLDGTLTLTTMAPRKQRPQEGPVLPLTSLEWSAHGAWDAARTGLVYGENGEEIVKEVLEDDVRLTVCPEDDPDDPDDLPQTRTVTGEGALAGVSVTVEFLWPPAPTGTVAGYTAPMKRWTQTRITGLTSQPITLTDWFAQTYRPEHHNFAEHFLFEPRLDPGVPAATLEELDALGVALIYTYGTPWAGETTLIRLFDADGDEVTLD